MFTVSSLVSDNIVEDAVVVPIISYNDFTRCVEGMKKYAYHPLCVEGVPCYLGYIESEDGLHTNLFVKTSKQDSGLVTIMTIIVEDKELQEALILLDDVTLVESIGLTPLLEGVNKIFKEYL